MATAHMLESMGVTVSMVDNGAAAIVQVQQHRFDLIFMDCQMPTMDGFEATRTIRAWEAALGQQTALPIIALTANALAGDREACLAAGMTDYLSKPITLAALVSAFERQAPWLLRMQDAAAAVPPSATPRPPATAPQPPDRPLEAAADAAAATAPPLVYDPGVLASLPMVADGSDPGFADQMIRLFCDGCGDSLSRIDQALHDPNTTAAVRAVHTLKSSAAQVGALALAAEADHAETALRRGQAWDAGRSDRLRRQVERFVQAVQTVHAARAAEETASG